MEVRRKYAGLRFLAFLIKLTAWIILLASIGLAIWFWSQGTNVQGLQVGGQNWTGLLLLPIGIYTFFQLYIFGSVLTVFTAVEYNTRANATATAKLIKLIEKMERSEKSAPSDAISPAPPPPPPPPPVHEEPIPPTERIPAPPSAPSVPETQPLPPMQESAPQPPLKTPDASDIVTPSVVEDATKAAQDAATSVDEVMKAVDDVIEETPVTKIMPPAGDNPAK